MAKYVIATLFDKESIDFINIVQNACNADPDIVVLDLTHMSVEQACYFIKKGLIDTCMFSPETIVENYNWRKVIDYSIDQDVSLICAYNSTPRDIANADKIGELVSQKRHKPISHFCKDHFSLAVQSVLGAKNNSTIQKQKEQKKDVDVMNLIKTAFRSISKHDKYTTKHVKTMALIAKQIGKKMNLSDEELEVLLIGSLLHDIGKLDVENEILQKNGRPTEKEWQALQQHVVLGEIRLNMFELGKYERSKIVASQHHERYDGSGYPRGLKGDQIDILSRIASVSDAAQAMFGRVYKEGKTKNDLIDELHRCSGTQFDPMVADVLCEILDDQKSAKVFGLEYDKDGKIVSYKEPTLDELFEDKNSKTREQKRANLPER